MADQTTEGPAPFIRHVRSDLNVILATMDDHSARGIPLPENLIRAAVATAAQCLASTNERVRAAGMKFVLGSLSLNLNRFAEADRIARLDGGMPTERTEHTGTGPIDLMALAAKDPKVMKALMDSIDREEGIEPLPDGPRA